MDAVSRDVKRLVKKELMSANAQFGPFASSHEGWAVIREETDEAQVEITRLEIALTNMWNSVKCNKRIAPERLAKMQETAVNLAVEAIQVAAMAKKFAKCQNQNEGEDENHERHNKTANRNTDHDKRRSRSR